MTTNVNSGKVKAAVPRVGKLYIDRLCAGVSVPSDEKRVMQHTFKTAIANGWGKLNVNNGEELSIWISDTSIPEQCVVATLTGNGSNGPGYFTMDLYNCHPYLPSIRKYINRLFGAGCKEFIRKANVTDIELTLDTHNLSLHEVVYDHPDQITDGIDLDYLFEDKPLTEDETAIDTTLKPQNGKRFLVKAIISGLDLH